MKIFSYNSNNIINIITKFKNGSINNKELNKNILSSIIFNFYYFKRKTAKSTSKIEKQKKLYQNYFSQEEKQIKMQKLKLSKERNKNKKEELLLKFNKERKSLIDEYKKQSIFSSILENNFDYFIPNKQFSIPLEFYVNKTVINFFGDENNDKKKKTNKINEEESKKDIIKGKNEFNIIIPSNLCEDNDNFFINDLKDDENNINELINILKTEDNVLFYEDEKMDLKTIKKSVFQDINKTISNSGNASDKILEEDFELDKNLSKNEIVENHYKEFNFYLPINIYSKYIKKMTYAYLHLMLMNYFDLENKLNYVLDLHKETIAINHIKSIILQSGICSSQLYEKIIKNIISLKDNYSFENYLKYFNPVFQAAEEFQSYKYKYLLYLSRNKYNEIMTQLEYDIFLNLVKGKVIYDKETYSDLIKRFKVIYKKQYPNDHKIFYYKHVNAVIELIIDLNYENLADIYI